MNARLDRPCSQRNPLALGALLGLAAACGGGSSSEPSASSPGALLPHPDGDGTYLFADVHRSGSASTLKLLDVAWGRLVDVFDRDPATGLETLRFRELVVGRDVKSDGTSFELRENPVTGVQELVVLHPLGSAGWEAALPRLEVGLQGVQDVGAGGVLTMVARNAALVLHFDDLLDPGSIGPDTVRLATGLPATQPFEARVFADRNHGDALDLDGDGVPEHHATRVVLDLSVSEFELLQSPGLSVNVVGLPEALQGSQPNAILRVPTRADLGTGQFQVLRNRTQHPLALVGNGSTDPTVATLDVVRAFRSGGGRLTPPDPDNGFLPDDVPPRVLGSQAIQLTSATPLDATGDEFSVDVLFAEPACLFVPETGDVIELTTGVLARVSADAGPPPPGSATVTAVRVRRLAGDPGAVVPGSGRLLHPFEPAEGDPPECFVRFAPAAGSPPAADVLPGASAIVRFSEAMEPAGFEALRTFGLVRAGPVADGLQARVVGSVRRSADLLEVRFLPAVPLTHASGSAEAYRLEVAATVTDLAGNALADALPPVTFTLAPAAPAADTFGFALDFSDLDQDGDGGAEFRGQFVLDPASQAMLPRTVARFSAVADAGQPTIGLATPIVGGLTDPLSRYGSHLQHVYRYPDLGLALGVAPDDTGALVVDDSGFNLDVEGLNWSPAGGVASFDRYDQFQVLLSHSRQLPDETPTTAMPPTPMYPASGLSSLFAANHLEPPMVVHERALGYAVDPLSAFTASTGTVLVPWPLNRDRPAEQFRYFTWRDTRLVATGGANSGGVDLGILAVLAGLAPPDAIYPAGSVPSIGLPLLMEFRCYPDDQVIGTNRLATARGFFLAPAFRAYSTGGVDVVQQPHVVDPDNDPVALGGYDPTSVPPGQQLPGTDNVVHLGQVDFVVRVSVAHSAWFDSGAALGAADWVEPVVEPEPGDQPGGTSVALAFRGADDVDESTPGSGAARDAALLGAYGEYLDDSATVTFSGGDATWQDSADAVDGARFLQVRVTLVSNPATGQRPRLAGLGLAGTR